MRLYTKTGDGGETSLYDGTRVRKDHLRVSSYGDVDELNAHLGVSRAWASAQGAPNAVAVLGGHLRDIQSDLFAIGADLATPRAASEAPSSDDVRRLEQLIDKATAATPALRSFVLPAGTPLATQLHVCRTVCRRAERSVVALAQAESVSQNVIVYLNRLSDLLFAWARLANHAAGRAEEPWQARK